MISYQAHALLPEGRYRSYRSYSDYLAATGEDAVRKALALTPDEVEGEISRSGLRGRGGAGFPTGTKWKTLRAHPCPTRYVVCNAAEGEPGTFKDRYLLRKNPYAVLEGMRIAAHVVGATKGYLALKASFEPEIARVRAALEEMKPIFEGFDLEIALGPEDYLFGEEKALLNVIEGEAPLPREADDPPYEHGLFATPGSPNPALVNNAETFAHVPSILRHGADSFREVGTSDTPGTLLFTISGDVERPGVYEREAGITLRELIIDVAGGPGEGHQVKAILPGVSSRVLGPADLDLPIDFGHFAAASAGLGSAGFVVYDERRSALRLAQVVARFLFVESCNQCSACKAGLGLASAALDGIDGAGASDLPDRAIIAAHHAPQGNRCYLPVQGAVLLPSLIMRYRADFDGHAPNDEIPLPKMIDLDEEQGRFVYAGGPVDPRFKPPSTKRRIAPLP